MEIITNFKNWKLNLEINRVYLLVAHKEKNKDSFIQKIYFLNKEKINYIDLNDYDDCYKFTTKVLLEFINILYSFI